MQGAEITTRREKRRQRNAIIPLPKTRVRALTIGDPHLLVGEEKTRVIKHVSKGKKSKERQLHQWTTDHLGVSRLWNLPFEIREQIWKYVGLCGHHVHIVRRKKRLASVYCPAKDPTSPSRRDLCLLTRDRDGFHKRTAWPPHPGPMSLLLTCRQMLVLPTLFFNGYLTSA